MSGLFLDTHVIAHPRRSVASIMLQVIAALVPGIAVYVLFIDVRLLVNLLVVVTCALLFEAALVKLRKRAALPVIKDNSVALAAILLLLSVPQGLPIWQLVLGVFTMCALGKHVFGGLGHNPFNPAMVAYAVLIVSFPLTMTQWSSTHGLLDDPEQRATVANDTPRQDWDSISGATPLDRLDTLQRQAPLTATDSPENIATNSHKLSVDQLQDSAALDGAGTVTPPSSTAFSETTPASASLATELVLTSDWFWLSLAWLLGGLYLLLRRIISWHIPVSMLSTLWTLYFLCGLLPASSVLLPANIALFSGAIMLGAFFIATDPVSAATSNPGKLVYGAGIGLLCFVIREFSAYPEGVAFAVLLMNMCVPLIDHAFTRNRLTGPSAGNSAK